MEETWLPVRGYEDHYEVSNMGAIRRSAAGRGATAGRLLRFKRPTRWSDYCRVQLCRQDTKRTHAVHVLVCEAFHGKRPRNKFANHIDLDKLNNAASNLEWVTRKQNSQHAIKAGRQNGAPQVGAKNGRAKLTASQVAEIRRMRGVVGQRTLAALCGVSKTCIQWIHQGKHWAE